MSSSGFLALMIGAAGLSWMSQGQLVPMLSCFVGAAVVYLAGRRPRRQR